MRRLALILAVLAVLAVPAGAFALRAGDGTLAIRNAAGDPNSVVVSLNVFGAAIGQVDSGKVLVEDLSDNADLAPVVSNWDRTRDLPSGATLYSGTDLRFRAVGGHYRIRILGRGIDVNVVGRGVVRLNGSSSLVADGRFSLDGGPWLSLPDDGGIYVIGS